MKHKVKHKSNKTNKGAKVDDPTVLRINQTARLAAQKARSVVGTGKHSQDSDSSGEPPIFRTVDPEGLGKKPTTMSYVDDPNKGRNSAPVAKPGSLSGEAARNGATDIKPTSPVTGRHGATGYEAAKNLYVVGTGKHSQDSDSSGEPPIFRTVDPEGLGKKPTTMSYVDDPNKGRNSAPVAKPGSLSGEAARNGATDIKPTSPVTGRHGATGYEAAKNLYVVGTGKHSQDSDSSGEPPIFRTVDPEGLGKKPTTMSYVDDPNKGRNSAPVAKPGSLSGEAARNGATDIKPTSPVTGRHGATGYEAAKNLYAGKSQKEVEQLNNFFKMQVANDASLAQRGQQTKAKQNFDSMLKRQAAASVQAKADREDNDWARSTLMKKPSLSTKKPSKPPVATGGYSRGNSNGYDEVYKPKSVVYPPPKTYRPGVNTPRAI